MDVINLDSGNFTGLTARYTPDSTVNFNQDVVYTEEYLSIPVNEILKEIYDNRVNNFSNLTLTRNDLITSAVNIEKLEKFEDEGFSTFFAVNAAGTITPTTKFWVVTEPPVSFNTATVRVSGEYSKADNRYMFDIILLDEKFCKIMHENNNVERYLTMDFTGNLSFVKQQSSDLLGALSPQIFYYIYDRTGNYIVLIKNALEIPKFVNYNAPLQGLTLVDPITGSSVPYSISSVFRVRPRNKLPNETKLFDPWVSYNRDFKTNSQEVNDVRTFANIKSNFMLNSEYYNISSNHIDFNILSLKNINTAENRTSRNNPFFSEDPVQMREYQALMTGYNQNLGNDNILINYETYTDGILFKKDKVTYFYIPQVFYPFEKLNINDAGLIEAGAVAGDHPIKSDKIFKKKADYKYTSNFGDSADENTGEFLCAWLSGNTDVNIKPIWVDRYYNPKKISFVAALTSTDFTPIKYISLFDCLVDKAFEVFKKDVEVFDKPSDLIFEKGTYYAYHHYGPKGVNNFIETFNSNLVNQNIPIYKFFNGSDVYSEATEYNNFYFDGTKYGITSTLSAIHESNQFTLIFDAFSSDWSKPLANQIIGNYDRDGFGIFNEKIVTPTLFINSMSSIYVTNIDFKILNQVAVASNISALIRTQGLNDFFGIFKDNRFRRFNLSYSEIRRSVSNISSNILGSILNYDYDENNCYAIIFNSSDDKRFIKLDLNTNEVIDITFFTSPERKMALGLNESSANTINLYNNVLYLTPGIKSERCFNNIFYLEKNGKNLLKWSEINTTGLNTITAFRSNTGIQDFSLDFNNNVWILYNDNKFAKYTADREFLLSGTLGADNYTNFKIEFTSDFNLGELNQHALIVQQSYKGDKKNIKFNKVSMSGKIETVEYFDKWSPLGTVYICNSALNGNVFNYPPLLNKFNSGFIENQITTQSDYTLLTTLCSSLIPFFYKIDNNGLNIANSNFLRSFVKEKYPESSINIRAQLTNIFNINDTVSTELAFNLSGLDAGYHNFAVRFDADTGYMFLFVDGQNQGTATFTPRKYKFSNLINRPFLIGSSNFSYSIPLFSYLKNKSFLANDLTIKNLYIYDKPLYDFDIIMHARKNMDIKDIVFDVACGRRNYIEEIERYFKCDIPGSKSTAFNIIIRNSGITDPELRYALEQRIISTLRNSAPVYSKLNSIKWRN
jgi:hypothetical protein